MTVTPSLGHDDDQASLSGAVTFTADDWYEPQAITITGKKDDDGYHEDITITHAVSGYGDVRIAANVNIKVIDTDTDSAGVTIDTTPDDAATVTTTLNMVEGESAEYEVVLDIAPAHTTTITIKPTASAAGIVTIEPAELKFGLYGGAWNEPQTVTVTRPYDTDGLDDELTITHSVSGDPWDYYGVRMAPAVTVNVDDRVGMIVSTSETISVPEGGEDTYTVVLTGPPISGAVRVIPWSIKDTLNKPRRFWWDSIIG